MMLHYMAHLWEDLACGRKDFPQFHTLNYSSKARQEISSIYQWPRNNPPTAPMYMCDGCWGRCCCRDVLLRGASRCRMCFWQRRVDKEVGERPGAG